MLTGRVKWFHARKGYGFLVGEDAHASRDVFVHHSVIAREGFRTLAEGEQVRYEARETSKGAQATRVEPLPPLF